MGVEWQGLDGVDPDCAAALRRILGPVVVDLEATTSVVDLVVDPRPLVGCGCVLLPPGMTWEDVTSRGMKHPDLGPFFAYGSIDHDFARPLEQLVAEAASQVQRMAIAMIWTRTGVGGWPLCPVDRTHPLWPYPDRASRLAVWGCRGAGYQVPIGTLADS